jgi:acetyltransferase-like isoleucine patch superfamily enzyme
MNKILQSFKVRGIIETIVILTWLFYRRVWSFLTCLQLNIRGYSIDYSVIFYGSSWMERSTKKSILIGKKTNFGGNNKLRCYGAGEIKIGDNCSIGEETIIHAGESVEIGNNVLMGARCYINDTNHDIKNTDKPIVMQGWSAKKIIIEDNVWLGVNVTILDGVKIGRNSVVGAGAVVTKDVPANVVAAGIPAKVLYKRI